jgi:hypothetical protein
LTKGVDAMLTRMADYFRTNKWWVLSFIICVFMDAALTIYLLSMKLGAEANPFIRDNVESFDWGFHIFRVDVAFLIIPLIALTKWDFARNWLLQAVTISYVLTIANSVVMLLTNGSVCISFYQFLPDYLYLMGFLLQFCFGLLILYGMRKTFNRHSVVNML